MCLFFYQERYGMHVVAKDPKVRVEVDNYIEEAQEGKSEAVSGEFQEDWAKINEQKQINLNRFFSF